MRTVVSPGAEARAGALLARAERSRDWLADQLASPFSFDLFVLDEDEWADHAEVPVYAIPHANSDSGKIVLGSRPATLFDSVCAQFWLDFDEDSRGAMHRVYGNPLLLEEFADLILVHELLHLVPRGQSLPMMWQEELFANLGAVGYLSSEEPDELPVYMTFSRAGCDVPPSRVACSALVDMASSFEAGGFANYVWYQCRLILAAERLWNTHGVEALRALQAGEIAVATEVERDWR
ncbi:MAG TPA: hypothetical protein VLJ76_07855 [Gaiellaceae bacterium]|nr:hypothetical protein [Gaiellaceae bacterium]